MDIEQATITKWIAGIAGGVIMVLQSVTMKETIDVDQQQKHIVEEIDDIQKVQAKTLEEILKVIKARNEKEQQHGS